MHPDHRYRRYTLRYDPPPIPIWREHAWCFWHDDYDPPPIPIWREHAWCFWHDDYDGSIDVVDYRHGTGRSVADCARQIDEIEAEQN